MHYQKYYHFMALPVKKWRVLLEQTFTASMPLLMATITFALWRRR